VFGDALFERRDKVTVVDLVEAWKVQRQRALEEQRIGRGASVAWTAPTSAGREEATSRWRRVFVEECMNGLVRGAVTPVKEVPALVAPSRRLV
jgi:valyl-tRNA synthetase